MPLTADAIFREQPHSLNELPARYDAIWWWVKRLSPKSLTGAPSDCALVCQLDADTRVDSGCADMRGLQAYSESTPMLDVGYPRSRASPRGGGYPELT